MILTHSVISESTRLPCKIISGGRLKKGMTSAATLRPKQPKAYIDHDLSHVYARF
jgi:hypothetical protein